MPALVTTGGSHDGSRLQASDALLGTVEQGRRDEVPSIRLADMDTPADGSVHQEFAAEEGGHQ
jgi:hypothetical protein